MSEPSNKAVFASGLTALLVTAGSSVGLGNIWRFPYLVGEGGGGAFLIIYLLAVIFIGHPIMLAEFAVGRSTHLNPVGAYSVHKKRWGLLGFNGVLAAFLVMGFYLVVSGWTLEYVVVAVAGEFASAASSADYGAHFEAFVSHPYRPLIYAWIFLVISHIIIAMGVEKGLERVAKVLMPALFVMLVILAIASLMMPGSIEGLKYLFIPDFSKVTPRVVLDAVGQLFFSLSLAMGPLITFASYFRDETDLRQTATRLTLLDTGVAILASVIILPAVFSVGIEPSSGPSLVFITLPSILNTLPFSQFLSIVFFALLFVAALTSTLSVHEVVTLYLSEEFKMTRKKAVRLASASVSVLATLSALSFSVLSEHKIFGLGFFDLLDSITSHLLMPLGGVLNCIYVGWVMERSFIEGQLRRKVNNNDFFIRANIVLLRYICPVAIFIIFLDGVGVFS
ncbi:MAG: sodium-dependent transporter [Rikenellaceae bacterium]